MRTYTEDEIMLRIRFIHDLKIAVEEAKKMGRAIDNMTAQLYANREKRQAA